MNTPNLPIGHVKVTNIVIPNDDPVSKALANSQVNLPVISNGNLNTWTTMLRHQ